MSLFSHAPHTAYTNTHNMRATHMRVLRVSIVVCALVWVLSVPALAHAFFSGSASANNAALHTGTLTFSLSTTTAAADISEGATTTVSFTLSKSGSIGAQYALETQKHACADGLYEGLALAIDANAARVFNGAVLDAFASSTADGVWDLSFGVLPDAIAIAGDTCEIDIVVRAWQGEFSDFSDGGFSDEHTLRITLTALNHFGRTVVLNEVLPNPEGSDAQAGLQGEWVELANTAPFSVDVTGWYIEDEAGNRISIDATSTFNSQVVAQLPGSFAEWIVVFMPGAILNNDGDTVYLYDSQDNLRDFYAYGASVNDADSDSNNTPGGDNAGPAGGETSGSEGKSDARIPDGVGPWIDPIPTPGAPNELDAESAALFGLEPTKAPQPPLTMEIRGENPAFVAQGSAFNDLRATAANADGDSITVHSEGLEDVDVETPGEYRITYTASVASGHTIVGERVVVVYEREAGKPEEVSIPRVPFITLMSELVVEEVASAPAAVVPAQSGERAQPNEPKKLEKLEPAEQPAQLEQELSKEQEKEKEPESEQEEHTEDGTSVEEEREQEKDAQKGEEETLEEAAAQDEIAESDVVVDADEKAQIEKENLEREEKEDTPEVEEKNDTKKEEAEGASESEDTEIDTKAEKEAADIVDTHDKQEKEKHEAQKEREHQEHQEHQEQHEQKTEALSDTEQDAV